MTISTPSVTTSDGPGCRCANAAMRATALGAVDRVDAAAQDRSAIEEPQPVTRRYGAMSGSSVRASDSGIAPSGDRHGPAAKPNRFIAHFTGIGLVIANSAVNSGCSSRWMRAGRRHVAVIERVGHRAQLAGRRCARRR